MPTEEELARERLGRGPGDAVPPGLRNPGDGSSRTMPGARPNQTRDFGVGLFGWEAGGPLHPGHTSDQHLYGPTKDGENINVGHIWTEGLFYKDMIKDGPAHFEEAFYEEPSHFPLRSYVHLQFDPKAEHQWPGGTGRGKWKWWAEVPEMVTVPPETPRRPGIPTPEDPPPSTPVPPTGPVTPPRGPAVPPGAPGSPTTPPGNPGGGNPGSGTPGSGNPGGGANSPGGSGAPTTGGVTSGGGAAGGVTAPGTANDAPAPNAGAGVAQPGQPGFIGPMPWTPPGMIPEDIWDWDPEKGWVGKPIPGLAPGTGPLPSPFGNKPPAGVPIPSNGGGEQGGGIPNGGGNGPAPGAGNGAPPVNPGNPGGGGGGGTGGQGGGVVGKPPPPSAGGPAYGSSEREAAWRRYYESLYGAPTQVPNGSRSSPSYVIQHGVIWWFDPLTGSYTRSRPKTSGVKVPSQVDDS